MTELPATPNDEPVEGHDAGPSDEHRKNWLMEHVASIHARASELAQAAHQSLSASRPKAEAFAREALTEAATAYWYAEETHGALAEHVNLHQLGRWTCETFGCEFDWDGETYTTSCPVHVADKRFGFSPTIVAAQVLCSVCDQDLSGCPHSLDRLYWVKGERTSDGMCRVCNSDDGCDHRTDVLYRAPVYRIRKGLKLLDASIVDVPRDPNARAQVLRKRTTDLMRATRQAFPGAPEKCTHCRQPYHGLPEPLDLLDTAALFWLD